MRLEYQDNIDRYLLGMMSNEERESFEAKCADNSELKEQLEHTRDVRTVISERSKMLAKIQEWDDEYDAKKKVASNKVSRIYWLSGIAALLVIGFFLYPTIRPSEENDTRELTSINQKPQNKKNEEKVMPDSDAKNKEAEHLLAQNYEKKSERGNTVKPEKEQVLSFGKTESESAIPQGQDGLGQELRNIEDDLNSVQHKMAQLHQQLNESAISQDFYDSSIGLLKYQRDYLSWRKTKILINLGRRNEALVILKEMRREKGSFRDKADSLYNEIK